MRHGSCVMARLSVRYEQSAQCAGGESITLFIKQAAFINAIISSEERQRAGWGCRSPRRRATHATSRVPVRRSHVTHSRTYSPHAGSQSARPLSHVSRCCVGRQDLATLLSHTLSHVRGRPACTRSHTRTYVTIDIQMSHRGHNSCGARAEGSAGRENYAIARRNFCCCQAYAGYEPFSAAGGASPVYQEPVSRE